MHFDFRPKSLRKNRHAGLTRSGQALWAYTQKASKFLPQLLIHKMKFEMQLGGLSGAIFRKKNAFFHRDVAFPNQFRSV